MKDADKPVTQGQVAGCAGGAAAIIGAIVLIGGALLTFFYMMACANMPTGCH